MNKYWHGEIVAALIIFLFHALLCWSLITSHFTTPDKLVNNISIGLCNVCGRQASRINRWKKPSNCEYVTYCTRVQTQTYTPWRWQSRVVGNYQQMRVLWNLHVSKSNLSHAWIEQTCKRQRRGTKGREGLLHEKEFVLISEHLFFLATCHLI